MESQNNKQTIRQDFVYPELNDEHRTYGGSFLNNPIVNPTGEWRKALPLPEEQRRNKIESSACFIEAQQHVIATIEEFRLNEIDNNYSARFNARLSDSTRWGGDPIVGADSIRHDGLVREESMPFDNSLLSWEDFHSWKGINETKVRAEGQKDISIKDRNFGVIVEKHFPLNTKYELLRQGLLRSPICMSVWGGTDADGNYLPKPDGVDDTHMVEATCLDGNVIHILDTYPPFEKTLPPNYNFDFAMGWTVSKKVIPKQSTFWQSLLNKIKSWFI